MTTHSPPDIPDRLRRLAERWSPSEATERASLQSYLLELCEALGVPRPVPPAPDYQFERTVIVVDRDGAESTNYIDLWKADHFALEGKALFETAETSRDRRLRKAFGQVHHYAMQASGTPVPFLMVLDVARTLIVWDRWSGGYGGYQAGRRIPLEALHDRPDDIALLRDIWTNPAKRDPHRKAQAVTQDLAGRLARFAAALEQRGGDGDPAEHGERVARFVMRCVFCCFAEDVGLLRPNLFRDTLRVAASVGDPDHFAETLTTLWRAMDAGKPFGADMLNRFNGHFFKSVDALPLNRDEMQLLIDAASADWSKVEPTIFGTLLVRALDPVERHRLGAEYTPRAYIERLVKPTVEEPIRERWTAVQAEVLQLEADAGGIENRKPTAAQKKALVAALARLDEFHAWMRGLRFLDPACGSGNFLYVTMDIVKHIELEVLREKIRLSHGQEAAVLEEVHPRQFHGIEIKPWAREIAELTLWIGYHQWWRETHGGRTPPIPILEDTGTLECRDAVLAYDGTRHDPSRDRPDPTPRIRHPVTGELVPDPAAKLEYIEYLNPRWAEWPAADFIVGNPPYVGEKRQRETFGDGYVDALREAYEDTVNASADFVMYWWVRAAREVSDRRTLRAGLITTNSIAQSKNRAHVSAAREAGARVLWAVPDHPWVENSDGAAVRVAITVVAADAGAPAHSVTVDKSGSITSERLVTALNDDLSPGADVATTAARVLHSNVGLCWQGFKLVGDGFLLSADEAEVLRAIDNTHRMLVRPWRNGKDLTNRPRNVFSIDFGLLSEEQARDTPVLYDLVRTRVKPERDSNRDRARRERWWRFGRSNENLRQAVVGLRRYVATVEVSKIRFFVFLDADIAPDGALVLVGSDSALVLGVLSSMIHVCWSLAAGGRMGVGNDPRYNKDRCFDAFPFPDPDAELGARIAAIAERLDAHRAAALARDERVTMTGMYNVVEKLRSGTALTTKERDVHEIAACGILKDLHDELDTLVAQAYGWPWPLSRDEILERLVALHDERVAEEKRGLVRWLRPEYQIPRFGAKAGVPAAEFALTPGAVTEVPVALPAWPATAIEQLTALTALLAQRAVTSAEAVESFSGASRPLIQRHLDTLALMGEVSRSDTGRYGLVRRVA